MVLSRQSSEWLKIIGIVTMVIDHIGHIFYPDVLLLRIIGRLTFPIFAYQLAVGMDRSSNRGNYLFRLLLFAMIAQIPYTLAIGVQQANILFTLLLAGLFILSGKTWVKLLTLLLPFLVPIDYGFMGMVLVLAFYYTINRKWSYAIIYPLFAMIGLTIQMSFWIQLFSILTLAIIYTLTRWENIKAIRIPKYYFYVFYPGHLLLLWIILNLI